MKTGIITWEITYKEYCPRFILAKMKLDLYEHYQGGDASNIRTSYQDEDGNNLQNEYMKEEWKHDANNQHGSEEIDMGSGSGGRAEGGFNFGSMEERMFM